MEYIMPLRVRYSETNPKGVTDLYKILDFFQDASIFHSESLGYGVQSQLAKNQGWFLLAWNVHVERFPSMGEFLKVGTEPYKMRGFYGYRRFTLYDEKNNVIAKADSLWLLMDLKKMTPIRVPVDMTDAYIRDVSDDKIRIKRKLPEDGDWSLKDTIYVNKQYLDSNSHVNNAYYALWAEELLPQDFLWKDIMIDYRQSAFVNDEIHIYECQEEGCIRYRFINQENVLLALVKFADQ